MLPLPPFPYLCAVLHVLWPVRLLAALVAVVSIPAAVVLGLLQAVATLWDRRGGEGRGGEGGEGREGRGGEGRGGGGEGKINNDSTS